ncbi:Glucosamine-phosphate N-acetyltransferase-like protein [Linnemannia schmuckeri]|uniref:Glucosamine 6-phosphate N-acetyltransferase n=1 Tax=Linnemannia schmuckeri TaxID=64567 RepID=A0A9P5VCI4_9FUNG|nr:Glucosamine-phosphate N-acetyltransferase-like protein [Linnemannia schmuckeri]
MSPQSPTFLFPTSLISSAVQAQLPEGYRIRPLEITDYSKGFYDCLAGLTVVGKVSEQSFQQTFEQMRRCENVYHIVVIEELDQRRIVATGTLIVEQKFLRGCAKAGHIEDIVVHDSQRGKKFGIRLIDQLKHIGTMVGCYKLLLTCSESNEVFYNKSGFVRKDLHMAVYLNNDTTSSVAIPVADPITAATPTPSTSTYATASSSVTAALGAATNSNSITDTTITTTTPTTTTSTPKPRTVSIEALSASMESIMVK